MNSKNRRIVMLMLIDCVTIIICSIGALALRFDISTIPAEYLNGAQKSFFMYCVIVIAVMYAFRLYSMVWTYASMKELYLLFKATLVIAASIVVLHVFTGAIMPRSYFPLMWGLMIIFFPCIRFSKVAFLAIKNNKAKEGVSKHLMVIGAGAAGSLLIKEITSSTEDYIVKCVIDDNANKKNKYIMGAPIVGDRYDIEDSVEKYNIDEIIIALPSIKKEELRKIIRIAQDTEKPVKILPSVTKSLTDSLSGHVRPINYEDLLGREPIRVDQSGIGEFLYDKVVLVTGGGGSIGSELCRQIVQYSPKKLIIFDIYENNAYEIQMELERHFPDVSISTLIGSIRDYDRMEAVFKKYNPNIVYHAAAHKHVPLMEKSPNEAIKNNCLGTLNVVQLADKYKVDNFILISTDKAVRPTNIMGATKRMCEMIVQTYAKKSLHTRFAAVRFGNVLGSNGSVIPLFLKQIEEGGPVTVTHKEITRFFMTIPEAVSLVLQASLYAKGGEIFVLDMGKPVRIYDLAENIIRMKGLKPGVDIKIEVVGLRPGEKLYEEILMDEEGLDKTDNNMIYVGKPLKFDEGAYLDKLNELIDNAYKNGYSIKEMAEDVCDTYTITDN